jgi:hypothetical protein
MTLAALEAIEVISDQMRIVIESEWPEQTAAETMIPMGTYFGKPIAKQPKDEAEHYIRCPGCGGWIDCRDLGQVFEHEAHPTQD